MAELSIELLKRMAVGKFGYGSWDADYWFIGPEEGDDKRGTLPQRAAAWKKLERDGLCDCLTYHHEIGELRWHGLDGKPPRMQSTWKQLIRLLLAYKNDDLTESTVRAYQAERWGKAPDETCVIELSGIPANCYAAGAILKQKLFDTDWFEETIELRKKDICKRLDERAIPPELLVMYGDKDQTHWQDLKGLVEALPANKQPQIAVLTHPTAFGVPSQYWIDWGNRLRDGKL